MKIRDRNVYWFIEVIILLSIFIAKYYYQSDINSIGKHQVVGIVLNFIIFVILVNYISRIVKYYYSKRNKLDPRKKNNVHFGIENIAKSILSIGFILALASSFGIDPLSLLTSLSIVAAALAIITREFINDFLAGLNLSFSKTFEIGDYVHIDKHKGDITEIGMFKTKMKNEDGDEVLIPNGKINANDIVNYTKRDIRLMSVDFQISTNVVESIEHLEDDIIQSLSNFSDFIEENSYTLKVVDLKKDYIDLKLQYKLKQFDVDLQRRIRRKTVREVMNYISAKRLILDGVCDCKKNSD